MECKGFSNEKFKPPYRANKSLSPKPLWNKSRLRLRFEGSCLKQEDTAPFTLNHLVNSQDLIADFTLKDCLFGSVEIIKTVDPDKYSYSGY